MHPRIVGHSKTLIVLGVLVSALVPALTLPRLPHVSPWPVLLGVAPWLVGKYVLCPLRWRALTGEDLSLDRPDFRLLRAPIRAPWLRCRTSTGLQAALGTPPGQATRLVTLATATPGGSRLSRRWHLRAYAESELLGLLTPGHVGAGVWRVRRLTSTGLGRGEAILSVGTDRLISAPGLAVFVAFAGAALPLGVALLAAAITVAALVAALVVQRARPDLLPRRALPPPRRLAHAFVLSTAYQLTIAALLMGTVDATGHDLSPLALLGAFGASQVAGAVPGPNGASPRDGALVVALMALGIPWQAALAAVSVKAAVAWLPAIVLGGGCLLLTRRAARRAAAFPTLA